MSPRYVYVIGQTWCVSGRRGRALGPLTGGGRNDLPPLAACASFLKSQAIHGGRVGACLGLCVVCLFSFYVFPVRSLRGNHVYASLRVRSSYAVGRRSTGDIPRRDGIVESSCSARRYIRALGNAALRVCLAGCLPRKDNLGCLRFISCTFAMYISCIKYGVLAAYSVLLACGIMSL